PRLKDEDHVMEWHVAVAQLRPKKGAYDFTLAHLGETLSQLDAANEPLDVLVLPEMALTGYFLQGGIAEVARETDQFFEELLGLFRQATRAGRPPLDVVIGFPERRDSRLFNSVLYATLGHRPEESRIHHVHRKIFLPTYGVFDEKRYVNRGRDLTAFATRAGPAGMLICEDAWHTITGTVLALGGARIVYIPVASPARGFEGDVVANVGRWHRLAQSMAEEHAIFVVTANLVGFEGGKGFIGGSVVVNPLGEIMVEGPMGEECILRATLDLDEIAIARAGLPLLGDLESQLPDVLHALAHAAEPHREGAHR
ncbi:MAG TPA: nitrilase-related carbon-nitrogen hydrolase, partial [Chloroflexota bacterium]|nr:nitrilase-related carbon-nitrogen hydrolase [Chloroflexota bacterium]